MVPTGGQTLSVDLGRMQRRSLSDLSAAAPGTQVCYSQCIIYLHCGGKAVHHAPQVPGGVHYVVGVVIVLRLLGSKAPTTFQARHSLSTGVTAYDELDSHGPWSIVLVLLAQTGGVGSHLEGHFHYERLGAPAACLALA